MKFAGEKAVKDVNLGTKIVPLPTSLCILRRVKGTEIDILGQTIIIGGSIPRYEVTTVELRTPIYQEEMFLGVHETIKKKYPPGVNQLSVCPAPHALAG